MTTRKILNESVTIDTIKVGDVFKTTRGGDARVIRILAGNSYIVEFTDKYKYRLEVRLSSIRLGKIRNPYAPTLRGKGYMGVGKYASKVNNVSTAVYFRWKHMLNLCYGSNPVATMCDEWLNFQVFAEWEDNITRNIDPATHIRLVARLDVTQPLHYSPTTAHILPTSLCAVIVNSPMLNKSNVTGVVKRKGYGVDRYKAYGPTLDGVINLGTYATVEEATKVVKLSTEKYVRDVAEINKHWMSALTYEQLMCWILPTHVTTMKKQY